MTHVEKHDEHDEGLPRQEAFDPTPPEENEIIVTWIGHASFLVQLGNFALLIDPVYATHCAPLPLPSLRRLQAPGVAWDDLPPIDAILITHNHYDHLDQGVVKKLANRAHFIVPDGLEKWMRKKQVQQVTPVAWWQQVTLCNEIKITSCPAQHFSARSPFDRNQSHWCGWMIEWRGKKIYHTGDSGYCPHFREIGEKFSPIDLAMIPIGAYAPRCVMKPMHMNPEEATLVHKEIHSQLSLAHHWGTFRLTAEPIMEPVRLLKESQKKHGIPEKTFRVLAIGESVRISAV